MGPPQQCRGVLDLEALARPIAVDHGIRLHNYFRIADNLLTQANVYREEKNITQLYVLLLRFSSLLCETIPKHRDYRTFKSIKKDFFKKKLLDVLNELESLKPVVQKKLTECDLGATEELHCLNRTYAASCRTDKHSSDSYTPQDAVRHQLSSSPSVKTDRQISEKNVGLPYPKEDTLSRHSILGPAGLSGQWIGPVVAMKVQYPTNNEITPSDISSSVPVVLNQDGLQGESKALPYGSKINNGIHLLPVEENTFISSDGLEEELCQLSIQRPSYTPILSQVDRPIFSSRDADSRPKHAMSDTIHYRRVDVPEELTACFLKAAETNTRESLETCGLIVGSVLMDPEAGEYFRVTALIIPKQKSTSNTTHPTHDCFMSSVDLHNHYSYQGSELEREHLHGARAWPSHLPCSSCSLIIIVRRVCFLMLGTRAAQGGLDQHLKAKMSLNIQNNACASSD